MGRTEHFFIAMCFMHLYMYALRQVPKTPPRLLAISVELNYVVTVWYGTY